MLATHADKLIFIFRQTHVVNYLPSLSILSLHLEVKVKRGNYNSSRSVMESDSPISLDNGDEYPRMTKAEVDYRVICFDGLN